MIMGEDAHLEADFEDRCNSGIGPDDFDDEPIDLWPVEEEDDMEEVQP